MIQTRVFVTAFFVLCPSAVFAQDGWHLFRGNMKRTGAAAKAADWDKRTAWQRPLLMDKIDGFPNSSDPDEEAAALIAKLRKDADPATLPGFFPLIAGDVCVYATYRDIRGVALKNIEIKTMDDDVLKIRIGHFIWKSITQRRSLSVMLEKPVTNQGLGPLIQALQAKKQEHLLYANPNTGAISSDGKWAYTISDVVFPALEMKDGVPLPMREYRKGNELSAWYIQHGKLAWQANTIHDPDNSPFTNTHFLGAPLAAAGKLYALNEKAGELRLLSIDQDPKKLALRFCPDVEKTLTLAKIPAAEQILQSPLRRTQPLHIAQQENLLVCPTHAGELVGVDRAKMAVLWTYRYRDDAAALPSLPHWQAACPIIHQNRIVFTAADSNEIHCIDLEGKKKWTAADAKGLYVAAVHDDLVLVVGKGTCRALKLADGTEKWKLEMGEPAGVGVLDGSLYYLPLRKDATNEKPAIWAIDLAKGARAREVNVPHPEALGNLALHRGLLVSQSFTHIAAFPLSAQ